DDKSFEDIEYVDASVPNPTIVSEEEENVVQREEEESLKYNSTPDRVFNSFESDNSLLDKFSPEFETFCDHSEETRSGNTTHANYSLPEYDSFCVEIEPDQERLINLVENNNYDSSNDPLLEEVDLFLSDNSIPPEPPDDNFDLEPEVILAVIEDSDEPDEHFDPGGEFLFLQTLKMLITFLSCLLSDSFFHISSFLRFLLYYSPLRARTQSLTLDYPPMVEAFLCRIYVRFPRSSYPLIDFSLGKSISVIYIAYSLFVPPLCFNF
nr:hypothetical protein [Tanacetum cinerariifolium]